MYRKLKSLIAGKTVTRSLRMPIVLANLSSQNDLDVHNSEKKLITINAKPFSVLETIYALVQLLRAVSNYHMAGEANQ